MASKLFVAACVQMVLFNLAYGQVLGRFAAPGCGCGCSNILPVTEQILPSYLPPQQLIYDQPTTVIQDSTVANNLANALQLLIVSNLLSNTLPLEQPIELVTVPSGCPNAPLAINTPLAINAPLSLPAPCGCGGACGGCGSACGGCGCGGCNACGGLNPYSIFF